MSVCELNTTLYYNIYCISVYVIYVIQVKFLFLINLVFNSHFSTIITVVRNVNHGVFTPVIQTCNNLIKMLLWLHKQMYLKKE